MEGYPLLSFKSFVEFVERQPPEHPTHYIIARWAGSTNPVIVANNSETFARWERRIMNRFLSRVGIPLDHRLTCGTLARVLRAFNFEKDNKRLH